MHEYHDVLKVINETCLSQQPKEMQLYFSIVYVLYIYIYDCHNIFHLLFIHHFTFCLPPALEAAWRQPVSSRHTHTHTRTHTSCGNERTLPTTHTNTKSKMKTIHRNMGITQNRFRCGSYKYIQRIHRSAFLYVIMIQPTHLIRTLITY